MVFHYIWGCVFTCPFFCEKCLLVFKLYFCLTHTHTYTYINMLWSGTWILYAMIVCARKTITMGIAWNFRFLVWLDCINVTIVGVLWEVRVWNICKSCDFKPFISDSGVSGLRDVIIYVLAGLNTHQRPFGLYLFFHYCKSRILCHHRTGYELKGSSIGSVQRPLILDYV